MTTRESRPEAKAKGFNDDLDVACATFVQWLAERIVRSGRGEGEVTLDVEPSGSFWLGRLAPEEAVVELAMGERGERLDPCAVGVRLRPSSDGPFEFAVHVQARVWLRGEDKTWTKSQAIDEVVPVRMDAADDVSVPFGRAELTAALQRVSSSTSLAAEVRVEMAEEPGPGRVLSVMLVNTSVVDGADIRDTNLYETRLTIQGLGTTPFQIEALPDSFRFDRAVGAYGVNCGVLPVEGGWTTTDAWIVDRMRPTYWASEETPPDLSFEALQADPLPQLRLLLSILTSWGDEHWGSARLGERRRHEGWTKPMAEEALQAAGAFSGEVARIAAGLALLEGDAQLLAAFKLMNAAMRHAARGRFDGWRPFQVGFLLANMKCLTPDDDDRGTVDIVWFATGGGKTETYLGLLVMGALFDRMRGKSTGVTAWSRFPLRMLSLQQTQRFADALAGAELARQGAGLGGDPFSVGFFVGREATPNRIRVEPEDWEPDPEDDEMPAQFKVLIRCPFCGSDQIEMEFDRRRWCLRHVCRDDACPWHGEGLPFYIVDEEIYRFLPTVIVGTLDKVASFGLQAAMRGLTGPPHGMCSEKGHGYVYARRAERPTGCLVPGCRGTWQPLPMEARLFGPSFRLQDELHLLRDSLGAVDAHYEALVDELELAATGVTPKILASSATLTGFERQSEVLYGRVGRIFPTQGPTSSTGFWQHETDVVARRFVGLAPRGVTGEYVADRLLTTLQGAVRELSSRPEQVCAEIGVDSIHARALIDLYGVNVVYGNTLRDLDAVTRSLESQQVRVEGELHFTSLTGRTPFEEVRETLRRLEHPEDGVDERLHIITASSMMSHGVDIDRLNVMVMLGMPLATAEFIQTTARVGRRWPGAVFVLHKIARERDASVYRSFPQFIAHADRFVEAVPITRRSRRVLERTIGGLEQARILHIHEPQSAQSLTTARRLREYVRDNELTAADETEAMIRTLRLDEPLDGLLRDDLEEWMIQFFRNLEDPAGTARFPSDLFPSSKPMISLRDVEELAPVRDMT